MNKKRVIMIGIACAICLAIPIIRNKTTSVIESIVNHTETSAITTSVTTNDESRNSNTIVIDAGHGGYDSGSVSETGVYEKDITLAIALAVGDILSEAGYDVLYTRTDDNVVWSSDNLDDLSTRVAIAEDANAAYYISIHTNSSDTYNDGAYGIETYLNYTDSTIVSMAESVQENLSTLGYTQNRGLKSTQEASSLYVIDKNEVPAMLIEIGFLSDQEDAAYMTSSQGQTLIAQAIADGIITSL